MRADAVHLNATGYREMATTLAEALRAQGWLKR
jgi:lysophospholipase L1-like esterase